MSNIAVPNRTDAAAPGAADAATNAARDAARTLLGAVVFACLLVTFTPFEAVSTATADAGNLVNQLGYTGLGLLALASHFLFTDRRAALSLLRPAWLLMLAYLLFSVTQSGMPADALRAVLFSLFAMIAGSSVLCLPPNERGFRFALTAAALAVLGLSYFGILALPGAAIHGADGEEPQHAGLWRGIYSHKNVAGPIMASLFFGGIYLMRSGDRWRGAAITLLAGLFVYKTGSKTTAALVPAVAAIVIGARVFGGRLLPVAIILVALAAMALLTLGSVLSPALDGVLQAVMPGTTFTGRTDIWRFALDLMGARQWTGFGFESFWLTPYVVGAEKPFELAWDPRTIVNSHSGYLDIAIAMGWPALLVAVFVLILLPFKDYVQCKRFAENRRMADFFLMVLAFALLTSFLESFLFKRADPMWMMTWIPIVGLRLSSRFRIAP